METGFKVSLAGHGVLLAAALVGWPFASDTDNVAAPQAVNVALIRPEDMPQAGATAEPVAPEVSETPSAPSAPSVETAPRPPAAPEVAPPPVDRVAPVPQPAPPDELPEADTAQPAIQEVPDPVETVPEQDPQEAQAPEEAAPEVVTEATETEEAPVQAVRPDLRPPERPTPPAPEAEPEVAEVPAEAEPAPDPTPETEPETVEQDAVTAALQEALSAPVQNDPAPLAAGPPLSRGERDGLRVAVGRCWNFAALSTEAAQVTVIVGMDMARDGTPGSLRLISFEGGSSAAAQQAFETARRAVLRCQPYALPTEKYDQWKQIEMTFNPDEMRRR